MDPVDIMSRERQLEDKLFSFFWFIINVFLIAGSSTTVLEKVLTAPVFILVSGGGEKNDLISSSFNNHNHLWRCSTYDVVTSPCKEASG